MEPDAPSTAPNNPAHGSTVRASDDSISATSALPELRLMNKNVNIDIAIQNNTILGRETGNYKAIFGAYNQISSKHCSFSFDMGKGWCVTDLGSTNGTKLNNVSITQHIPTPLSDKMFLKIANIEFYVQINN
jgi:pSer/pThr/pTyr-binding forkhead associated (FHA) protein